MSAQVQKSSKPDAKDRAQEPREGTLLAERGRDIKQAMDDLLEEIDATLEENAEEFVAGYVQRGGE